MNKITYFGDGQNTDFAFSFNFFQKSDIMVEINGIPQKSGYTLTVISDTEPADIPYVGGTISFNTPPKSTDIITIYRKIELTRVVDYQQTEKINPETLNQDANYLMEIIKDRKDEIDELHEQYSDIADKESTSVLLARIDTLNQQIENLEHDIQNGKVMSKDDFYSHATNCITYIPQDIKLELKDGALTLKAGSKIRLANGNLEATNTIATDISATQSNDGQYLVIRNAANSLYMAKTRSCLSGTITNRPSSLHDNAGLYFATDENKMYLTGDKGANWYSGADYSLPLGIVTVSNGTISSIDQVFNGFGYIGSTVFCLPAVNVLEPNGRNTDGTLKNTSVTIQNVITKTVPTNLGWHYLTINTSGTGGDLATEFYVGAERPSNPTTFSRYYNLTENRIYTVVSGEYTAGTTAVIPVRIEHSNSAPYTIISWDNPTVFRALDYNDQEYIANCAMPSDRYIDLTLGADGTTYTAPADGYLYLAKLSTASSQRIGLLDVSIGPGTMVYSTDTGQTLMAFLPVRKGQNIQVRYTLGGATNSFKFIYANGAK